MKRNLACFSRKRRVSALFFVDSVETERATSPPSKTLKNFVFQYHSCLRNENSLEKRCNNSIILSVIRA